ncbi:MAG: hypothetical protein NC408_09640 [Candidatus Gastranaerophilales bacterium]|nr:hypothetical protein [Candidatus Gastranaerophilales bacterium]MCM1074008.1 hypothetical protein [Bacteroides sp.]
MKKILLIIPVVFCLVLNSFSIISVYASNFLQTPAESYPGSSYHVHPLEQLLEQTENSKYYFWYNTFQKKDDDAYRIETKFIYYDDEISVEEDNGIYTIKFLGSYGFDTIYVEHDSLPDYDFKSGGMGSDVSKTLIFDSNTNELFRVRDNGEQASYITDGFAFNVFETNMFEADSGNFSVEFFPELTGEISNSVDLDGKTFNYPYLQVDVHNKTSDYYQYAIFIVEKGTKITFGDYNDISTSKSGYFFTNKAIYCYVTDEWFKTNTVINSSEASGGNYFGDTGTVGTGLAALNLVYAPSAWHRSEPNSNGRPLAIGWNQLNLVPNIEYDAVCIACPIKVKSYGENHISDYYIFNYPQHPINGSEPREVYRSTFTVSKAMPYDPNNNSSDLTDTHVYGFDSNNPNSTFGSLSALISDSGKLVVGNQKFGGTVSGAGHSFNNQYNGSSADYGSLLSNTRGFFSFLTSVLGFFPTVILTVFNLALWSLLIFALIRRLH